jgi:hypothetical protein
MDTVQDYGFYLDDPNKLAVERTSRLMVESDYLKNSLASLNRTSGISSGI